MDGEDLRHPAEQVVGSSGVVRYQLKDGKPVLIKEPKVEFVDDGPGKAVGINRFIGRRPVFAFGNSIGRLDKAWDEAVRRKWIVIDMKADWNTIYPFEKK